MPELQTIKVLCVEDDPGNARLLQKTPTRPGYEVDLASDGEQGLSKWLIPLRRG